MNKVFCLSPKYCTTRNVKSTNTSVSNKIEKKNHKTKLSSYVTHQKNEGGLRTQGYFKVRGSENCDIFGEKSATLITVITVVFNAARTIEETILSVIHQAYGNIEYIVIDGGSTDATLDIIRKYEHAIDYWVSENDKGIYDAMNKGINISTGDWVNFMNAGDLFNSTNTVDQIFSTNLGDEKIIYGDVHIRYGEFERVETAKKPRKLWQGMQFSHQSLFCDLDYHRENLFNIKNTICADLEFCYRAYKENLNFKYTPITVASVDVGGASEGNRLKTLALANKAVIDSGALPLVNLYYFFKRFDVKFRCYVKSILPKWLTKKIILIK